MKWSPRGKKRLLDCARYMAVQCQDRLTVLNWIDRIYATVEPLADFPLSGRVVPEIGRADIREVFCGDYRIIYRVKRGTPEIISVRHCHFRIRSAKSL